MGKATRFRGAKAQDARAVERVGEVVGVDAEGAQQALGGKDFEGVAEGDQTALVENRDTVTGQRLVEVMQRYQGGDRQRLHLLQQA